MPVGSVSGATAYMPTPQSANAASQAAARTAQQVAQAKAAQAKATGSDGDGDHGVEPQGSSGAPAGTGLLLNRSA